MTTVNRKKDIKELNSFLRGELSAVETYRQCIEKMEDPIVVGLLSDLRSSHQRRATLLKSEILQLGGSPATDSGVWGSFAKLAEGGAKLFGKSAAISMIEEGEDHGKKTYEDLDALSPDVRTFVAARLVPEQRRTHDTLSNLKECA